MSQTIAAMPPSTQQRAAGSEASPQFRAILLLVFLALVVCRLPNVVLTPRLWAEEGLFYQNAWYMPFWQALLFDYGGYLNLVANAAGLLAQATVPLADAPLVDTGIGLLFQTLPAILVLTSRAAWLRSRAAMTVVILALATAPATEEVWLQTLHSQNHLALAAALILAFDDQPGPVVRWCRRAVLLLAPLTGMLAVLLLPLMLASLALERSRERLVQFALLGLGSLIQVALFYSPEGGAALGRSAHLWPGLVIDVLFLRNIVLPFVGVPAAKALGDQLLTMLRDGHPPLWPVAVTALTACLAGSASLWRWRSTAPWLFAAGAVLAVASYAGSLQSNVLFDPSWSQRYSFAPQLLFFCTAVAIAADPGRPWLSCIAAAVVLWMTMIGLIDYPRASSTLFNHGPHWRAEVARWQADPDHFIRLWPDGWYLQLTPDHRPVGIPVRPPESASPIPHNDRME